jgi:hypothetical protein
VLPVHRQQLPQALRVGAVLLAATFVSHRQGRLSPF